MKPYRYFVERTDRRSFLKWSGAALAAAAAVPALGKSASSFAPGNGDTTVHADDGEIFITGAGWSIPHIV